MVEDFDIITFLDDNEIEYKSSGKNISSGWIGLLCPFCEDSSTHLGINLETKAVNCWKCGGKNLVQVVKELLGVSTAKAHKIISNYSLGGEEFHQNHRFSENSIKQVLPSYFSNVEEKNNPLVLKFFNERKIPVSFIEKFRPLYWAGSLGPFAGRLIIPVKMFGTIVSYVGRDVTERSSFPYKNAPKEKSLIPIKSCLYGYDHIINKDKIIVVEGIIDSWKLGHGSVATFGTIWTKEQISLLKNKEPKKIIILFDSEPEAQESARGLAQNIWFCSVEIVSLEDFNDPGELSIEEGRKLSSILRG